MSLIACCGLSAAATWPAFDATVPPPPGAEPDRPDVTMMIRESFMNRALVDAVPENIPITGQMDVQPGNRLVFEGDVKILVAEVPVVISLRIGFDGDAVRVSIESMEAAGYDLTDMIGMDASSLTESISRPLQEQIEAGLGPGAEILEITTDDDQLIIAARWSE
jgi:hypothetical protein